MDVAKIEKSFVSGTSSLRQHTLRNFVFRIIRLDPKGIMAKLEGVGCFNVVGLKAPDTVRKPSVRTGLDP
jgi:hypothetical protein